MYADLVLLLLLSTPAGQGHPVYVTIVMSLNADLVLLLLCCLPLQDKGTLSEEKLGDLTEVTGDEGKAQEVGEWVPCEGGEAGYEQRCRHVS
jgi:hypothetical protein